MAFHTVQDVSDVIMKSREVVGDDPPHTFQINPPVLMHGVDSVISDQIGAVQWAMITRAIQHTYSSAGEFSPMKR